MARPGDPKVTVTVRSDGPEGDTVHELDADSYFLVLGQRMEVGSLARHANGTVQLTLKRVKE